jgi:hypothetical protein
MINAHPAADRTAEDLDPPALLRPRRVPRISLEAEVTLRRSGQINYRVHVYDISLEGCRLEFVERPDLDELLWVRFDGLEALEAVVCWTLPPLVGLQFRRPIHPAVFDLLVSRLKAA